MLKQADDTLKKASNQNDINADGLGDILVRIETQKHMLWRETVHKCVFLQKRVKDLERERDLVQDQIVLAVKQLKDTEDVLNMFTDSKTVSIHKHRETRTCAAGFRITRL